MPVCGEGSGMMKENNPTLRVRAWAPGGEKLSQRGIVPPRGARCHRGALERVRKSLCPHPGDSHGAGVLRGTSWLTSSWWRDTSQHPGRHQALWMSPQPLLPVFLAGGSRGDSSAPASSSPTATGHHPELGWRLDRGRAWQRVIPRGIAVWERWDAAGTVWKPFLPIFSQAPSAKFPPGRAAALEAPSGIPEGKSHSGNTCFSPELFPEVGLAGCCGTWGPAVPLCPVTS